MIIQIVNIVTGVILLSIADQELYGVTRNMILPFQIVVLLALQISIFLLISRFLRKWQRVIYGFLLLLPNLAIGIPDATTAIYFSGMLVLFFANVVAVTIMTKDIFLNQHHTSYSLIGAANIYLGTPIIFTTIYAGFEVTHPGLMGFEYNEFLQLFGYCIEYSWYVLTGLENPIAGNVNKTILNVSIFESLVGNLFIIFVVGRLLAKDGLNK